MKHTTLGVLSATAFLTLSITPSLAEMNSAEILQRLQMQANSVNSMAVGAGSTQRGMTLNYGAETATPSMAVEPTQSLAPAPSYAAEPSFVSTDANVAPPATNSGASISSVPAYTYNETIPEPAVASTVAATPVTTSSSFETVAPVNVTPSYASTSAPSSIDTYQAVEERARVDLRIYFEWNSAALRPEAIGQLAELCSAIHELGAQGSNRFKIIGHTDKSGSADYNLYLSKARAREVKRHLVEECALPNDALFAIGEGERQSPPSSPSQAPEERRVEVQLIS